MKRSRNLPSPIQLDMDSLVREQADEDSLRQIFEELEFRTPVSYTHLIIEMLSIHANFEHKSNNKTLNTVFFCTFTMKN